VSLEGTLLLVCARWFVQQEPSDELRSAFQNDLEWSVLLQMAEVHSVMPVLYSVLASECPDKVPEQLRSRFQDHALSNLHYTAELVKLLQLLERNRICAVPIKGPILAVSAYGSLALRAFVDLDFLVRRDQVLLAKDLLIKEGYRLQSDTHWGCGSASLQSKERQLSLVSSDNRIRLDLHWRLLPEYFAPAFDGEQVWQNLVSVSLAGRDVLALSPEDLLLFLCAHGSKHRWECLGWICDVALVLKRMEIDWERFLDRARQAHIERMALLGLCVANNLFDSELPADLRQRINADPKISNLTAEVRRSLLVPDIRARSQVEKGIMNLRMIERLGDKIRFLRGLLITPTEAEWRNLRLPPSLYFLYYPYRLGRLVGRRTSAGLSLQ
jgi:hypothetical protein